MVATEIQKCIMADPFRPFTLKMNDGRQLPVFGRDFIMVSPNGAVIDLFQHDGDHDIFATSGVREMTYIEDEFNETDQFVNI